jgi:hypothetical protein
LEDDKGRIVRSAELAPAGMFNDVLVEFAGEI